MAAAGGLVIGPGTRAAAAATRVAAGRSRSCSRSSAGAVTTGALRALLAWGGPGSRSVGRPAAPGSSPPARFRPWATVAWPAWTARAAGLGLGRVGLAAAAAGLAVGSVDLHHDLAACGQEAGQGGAGGAGAFHAPAMAGRARGPSRAGPDSRWGWWGRCGCRRGGRAGRRRGRGGCPGGCRPTVIGWAAAAWAMLVMAVSARWLGRGWPARRPGGQPGDRSGRQARIRSPSSGWPALGGRGWSRQVACKPPGRWGEGSGSRRDHHRKIITAGENKAPTTRAACSSAQDAALEPY
jgi:hypothetical protein